MPDNRWHTCTYINTAYQSNFSKQLWSWQFVHTCVYHLVCRNRCHNIQHWLVHDVPCRGDDNGWSFFSAPRTAVTLLCWTAVTVMVVRPSITSGVMLELHAILISTLICNHFSQLRLFKLGTWKKHTGNKDLRIHYTATWYWPVSS